MRQALRRYLFTFVRERARQRWTEEHVGTPRVVAAGTLLDPDALTIGFARRFTGYKRPELIFHDPERLARILNAAGPARADHLRRQVASRRRHRQASPAARLQARARSAVRRPRRLRRRLRSARRAFPRAGLRRLAEQPAQAARGERHERHEGGDQRRAAPEHRRRLVGRRVQRQQRLADRRRRARATTTTRSTPPTRTRCTGCSRRRSCRPSTSATPATCRTDGWRRSRNRSASVAPRFCARRMVKEYVEQMYAPALDAQGRRSNESLNTSNLASSDSQIFPD